MPPQGWGALEAVVWNQCLELNAQGVETCFVNEKDSQKTLKMVKAINPDIVHLHYGKHYDIMPGFSCRKIVTNYDGSFQASRSFHESITRRYMYDCEFFLLREYEKSFFLRLGISANKIKMLTLGVSTTAFRNILSGMSKGDRSIYLGKIDERKRQHSFQRKGLKIDFVGPNATRKFDASDSCYLGEWTQEEKYNTLTEYGNLVLLSASENGNPPLVCLEAFAAGLGIVISEASNEGLDLSRKFITIISEDRMGDYDFIRASIDSNRKYSINHRPEILEYARRRDWSNMAKEYVSYL